MARPWVLRCLVVAGVLAACAAGWNGTPTATQSVMAVIASAAAALSVEDNKKNLQNCCRHADKGAYRLGLPGRKYEFPLG
jgi:hypothetical protein